MPSLSAIGDRARDRLRRLLSARIRTLLETRSEEITSMNADLRDLRLRQQALQQALDRHLATLDRRPIRPDSTVHAAWRRPGAREIFTGYGLPACLECAVGADETLAEAAGLEGLPLQELLDRLNALPPPAADAL